MGYKDYKRGNYGSAAGAGQTRHWGGKFGSGTFTPKKPVRSFRDLEVYQKTLECSVLIDKDILSYHCFSLLYCCRFSFCLLPIFRWKLQKDCFWWQGSLCASFFGQYPD